MMDREQAIEKLVKFLTDDCEQGIGRSEVLAAKLHEAGYRLLPELKPLSDIEMENHELREMLWANHPCEGKYGDDGELQCNRIPFAIDFKRDPVERIIRYCAIHNCQRQNIEIPEFLLSKPETL